MTVTVRPLESSDGMKVLAIYAEALKGSDATFETNVPTWTEWQKMHLSAHRFVAFDDPKQILGWAAVGRVSERREYAGVVECYTFVRADVRRTGVGATLLETVIASVEGQGLWTVQAHIFPENEAALGLHQKLGFRLVGTREKVGRHRGRWRDVQLHERRSPTL